MSKLCLDWKLFRWQVIWNNGHFSLPLQIWWELVCSALLLFCRGTRVGMGCSVQIPSPRGKGGNWGWDWWVNHVMRKELCPDWLNYLQGWFRKVISFNHSDQKVIIFGTPTLPFIKALTSLSHRSLPWLLPFTSIRTSLLTPHLKMTAAGKRGEKYSMFAGLQQIKVTPEKTLVFILPWLMSIYFCDWLDIS